MTSKPISREKANAEIETYSTIFDKISDFISKINNIGTLDKNTNNFISQKKNAFLFSLEELRTITEGLTSNSLTHLIVILGASDENEPGYPIGSQTIILTGATHSKGNDYTIPKDVTILQYPSKLALPTMGFNKSLTSLTVS
jgi:hypothetical protein